MKPNNSFKPKLLRSGNGVAEKACHAVPCATQFGLTQALGLMFKHDCQFEDLKIIAQRVNPLDASWSEWTLVVCSKCKALKEWQHHSEEQMHGGDLYITALPTRDYLHHIYGLAESDVDLILTHRKKARRYNRYTKMVEEHEA